MSDRFFEEVRQAMEKGAPLARYSKAILGRANVKILDQISGTPTDIILYGDATKGEETAILTFWTPLEVAYFERSNKQHIAEGTVVPYFVAEATLISVNAVPDEDLRTALESKFFSVQKLLRSFTSPTPALRMLAMAEEMNKPVGTINAIKSRVSELQAQEFEEVKK